MNIENLKVNEETDKLDLSEFDFKLEILKEEYIDIRDSIGVTSTGCCQPRTTGITPEV